MSVISMSLFRNIARPGVDLTEFLKKAFQKSIFFHPGTRNVKQLGNVL